MGPILRPPPASRSPSSSPRWNFSDEDRILENLFDLSPERLGEVLASVDDRPFLVDQVLSWACRRAVADFDGMTDVSLPARRHLARHLTLTPLEPAGEVTHPQGVVKFLFHAERGGHVESVLIPEEGRMTLCLSSQVGCSMGCGFCATARGGLERNLTRGEILAQVAAAIRHLGGRPRLRNLVFMGMGEPLRNLPEVIPALERLLDHRCFDFSPRRVTVSTCGWVPGVEELGRSGLGVNLAVSLNAADDQTRNLLMPVNLRYPLTSLMEAVRRYPLRPRQRVTLVYVLLSGVNDRPEDARRLAALVAGTRSKINLIPYNRATGGFSRPPEGKVDVFAEVLTGTGLTVTVRESRGEEIEAACGQLRAERETDGGALQ